MMVGKENNQPVVGGVFQGSKVVDVRVEVSDRGKRVRQRSTITLENGAILKQDHFKDKKFEEVDTKRRSAPPRTRSGDSTGLPQRGLPTSKSGRHLPKPAATITGRSIPLRAESPARGEGRRRSSSRGHDVIVCDAPVNHKDNSQALVTESPQRITRVQRHPPLSPGVGIQIAIVPLSPDKTKKNTSLMDWSPGSSSDKNKTSLRKFLASPKRKPPSFTKSGSALDAMRSSLHSANNQQSSKGGSEDTPRKPGSLKTLGKLMQKTKLQRSKSGDSVDLMREEAKKEPDSRRRRSTATTESNKEKLKSFKEMIASSNRGASKSKPAIRSEKRRSLQSELPPVTPKIQRRSMGSHFSVETPKVNDAPPEREASLSPEEVKRPSNASTQSGSSYVTSFLDKLYDSYIKDDDGEDSDEDSEGYGNNSQSLLDMSLNKFVEWVE